MTKQELLAYLGAVCDAENAIYSCNEMILALKEEKASVPRAVEPTRPARYVSPASSDELRSGSAVRTGAGTLLGWGVGIAVFLVIAYVCSQLHLTGLPMALSVPGAVIAGIWVGKATSRDTQRNMASSHEGQVRATKEAEADRRYQQQMQQYNNECTAYRKAKELEDKAIRIIEQNIARQQSNISLLQQQLDQLYARNVIYPSNRNIIAVNALREYLAMGICDALEGPNGAYAQYMQDVRVNRICTSIDDMKRQLVASMNSLMAVQGALLKEMKTTSNNISAMQRSISSDFRTLGIHMAQYQQAAADQHAAASAQLSSMTGILSNINSAAQATAHNHYIAAREANIRSYLLHRP